jgi:hypothetical protein
MAKRLNNKQPPTRVIERPSAIATKSTGVGIDTDGLSQGQQQVILDLLRTKLDRALILAHLKRNQIDEESREQTTKRALAICRFMREQLSKVPLDTQNTRWADEKLKEIEQLLEEAPINENPL